MSKDTPQLAHITLEQIAIDMEFGIAPHELGKLQRVLVDVTVGIDDQNVYIDDSAEGLKNGFDYSVVYEEVMNVARQNPKLMETFANLIGNALIKLPKVLECEVKISKTRIWENVPTTSLRIYRK
ncbi:dihydroneopterin aldolase [Polynucleobacter sp. JS-Polo-80-F4]|uniref:dihydroneopterin aldolase n=1 Tax=Polynucleobacter sp. JS-Polo-80-F4 TaxID=2576918 RepID=UPI001C0C4F45|nr:dihydroneopterin aldolase [Polynucleobacter sp. JS-Polo-80-F4]MBU3615843.1 dihydroneopterin aldolase [Polynucleobacter sp. JS-Polo-80-F4]